LAFQPRLQIGSLTACRVWKIGWTSKSGSTTVMNPPDAPPGQRKGGFEIIGNLAGSVVSFAIA
jgi:hypothetical protein